MTAAVKRGMIREQIYIKGCDEDGVGEGFQRVGGWCEPITDIQIAYHF